MSTLKDRLLFLLEKEELNPNQFYIKTGLANGFLDKVGSKMNRSTVEKIEKAFPLLNIDYLVFGKGEMFKTAQDSRGINFRVGDNVSGINVANSAGSGSASIKQGNTNPRVQSPVASDEVLELKHRIALLEEENRQLTAKLFAAQERIISLLEKQ